MNPPANLQPPNEAWRSNRKWATGVILDNNRPAALTAWIFALLWNALTIPSTLMALRDARPHHNGPPALLILIFPAAGILLLSSAIYQSLLAARFGRSELKTDPFPAHPGEPLNATIRIHASLSDAADVVAKLQCVRRKSNNSSRNSAPFEDVIWEDDQHAPIANDPTGSSLRATFSPPFDALGTDDSDPRNRILWRLIVHGVRAGIDYRSTFELPLFPRTPQDQTPPPTPFPRTAIPTPSQQLPTAELAAQRIQVRRLAGRALSVDFPPARRIGTAIFLTLFAAGFDAVAIFAARGNGMFISSNRAASPDLFSHTINIFGRVMFTFGFGLFGLFFTLFALSLWLVRVTATADRSGLTIIRTILGFHFRRTLPAVSIQTLTSHQTMSSGNSVFYSINAKTNDGQTIEFGSGIQGRHLADQLAAAMLEAVK